MGPDLLKTALFRVVDRLSAEAAYESSYGSPIPDSDEADRLARPILFDPRFDLEDGVPLVVDAVSRLLAHEGVPVDLKVRIRAQGLSQDLVEAETIGDFLRVLRLAMPEDASP